MDEMKSKNIIFNNNSQKLKIPRNLSIDDLLTGPTVEVIILPE